MLELSPQYQIFPFLKEIVMKKKLLTLISMTLVASLMLSVPVMASKRLPNGKAKTNRGIVYTYNENYTALLNMKQGNCVKEWDFDFAPAEDLTFEPTQFDAYLTQAIERHLIDLLDENGKIRPNTLNDIKTFIAQVHPDGIFAIDWRRGFIYTMNGVVIQMSGHTLWGVNEFVNGGHEFEAQFTTDASGKLTWTIQNMAQ